MPPPKVEVALPITARLLVVAVPDTTRFVVDALVVAVKLPMVADPMVARLAVREVVAVRFPKVAFPVLRDPPPVWSVSQPNFPEARVYVTLFPAPVQSVKVFWWKAPETARLVLEALTANRLKKVLEAVVLVAMKFCATTWPETESLAYGEEVPIPTLPLFDTVKTSVVALLRLMTFPVPSWVVEASGAEEDPTAPKREYPT
jgi:hypothetical protein